MSTETDSLNRNQQTALAGFEEFGLSQENLPQGFSEVSAKELTFVLDLLKHGNMGKAALAADPKRTLESAQVWASKALRKASVFRLYSAALQTVSKDADKLVTRVYERSVLFHDKTKEASATVERLQRALDDAETERQQQLADGLHESKLHSKAREQAEADLRKAQLDETRYASLAHKQDMLLGSLLGKLNLNVNVNGTVMHYTAGNEFTQQFAQQRRAWESQRHGQN